MNKFLTIDFYFVSSKTVGQMIMLPVDISTRIHKVVASKLNLPSVMAVHQKCISSETKTPTYFVDFSYLNYCVEFTCEM